MSESATPVTRADARSAPALQARAVSKIYGQVRALDSVSLEVGAGERIAIVGESGSGKSTLLRMFNRSIEPDAGEVCVGGLRALDVDPVALRRRTGYVPQDGGLLPHWTVLRNAATVPWLLGQTNPEEAGARALTQAGLDVDMFGARYPMELSGGQRQRVAIARAVAAEPQVLLLDEPFGALDAITRSEIQSWFVEFVARLSVAVVLVTHDLSEALLMSDRVMVLKAGRMEQVGEPQELLATPATQYVEDLLEKAGVRERRR